MSLDEMDVAVFKGKIECEKSAFGSVLTLNVPLYILRMNLKVKTMILKIDSMDGSMIFRIRP